MAKTETRYGWADWVFIISILILLLWIVGKSIGFIKSPVYVDMIPYLSIVFSAGALFQKFREMDKNIKETKTDVKDIETNLHGMDSRMIKLETTMDKVEVSLNVSSNQK
ncbi:MAG: hypothetical protein GWP10_05485 [Nitrospiraceae bacterium]|nr:hypothetical protein [Nitrospiraceae bacterium]